MTIRNEILTTIDSDNVGLDKDENLLVKGDTLVLSHMGTEQRLKATGGALLLNGGVVGGVPGVTTFAALPDPSTVPAGTPAYTSDRGPVYSRTARWQKTNPIVAAPDIGIYGDVVTDKSAAIQAAFDNTSYAGLYFPGGTYETGSTQLAITRKIRVYGDGFLTNINAGTVSGAVIKIGGADTTAGALANGALVHDLCIGGTATNGLETGWARTIVVRNIRAKGAFTDAFRFDNCWGSTLADLFTNDVSANPTNAGFYVTGSFFANMCPNWYTSNGSVYNVLLNAAMGGTTFSNMVCQGGRYGLHVTYGADGGVINGLYTEAVVVPLVLGVAGVAGQKVHGLTINGGMLSYPLTNHTNYATRAACIEAAHCYGVTINGMKFYGLEQRPTTLTVSGGGGSGAVLLPRVTVAGAIHSVEVLCGGAGYTSDPTVAAVNATAGSGATFTVTRSGGVITAVAVSAGGSAYTVPRMPVAVRYAKCYGLTLVNPQFTDSEFNEGSPFYPYIVRASANVDAQSSVRIVNDASFTSASDGAALDMIKREGTDHGHVLRVIDAYNVPYYRTYIPPVFA